MKDEIQTTNKYVKRCPISFAIREKHIKMTNRYHFTLISMVRVLPRWHSGKEYTGDSEIWVRSLGREDPLEKEMATHPSILAWIIPWTEEPGRLQSIGSQESDMTQ